MSDLPDATGPPKIFLACLPVLSHTLQVSESFPMASFISLCFLATSILGALARPIFPARLQRLSLVLWLAVLALSGHYVFSLSPTSGLSVFLLLESFERHRSGKEHLPFFLLVAQALGFWGLMIYLGFFQEILGQRLQLMIFFHPAGSFLLLALAAAGYEGMCVLTPRRRPVYV